MAEDYTRLPVGELLRPEGFACPYCGRVHKTGLRYLRCRQGALEDIPEVLEKLGWAEVQQVTRTKDGKTTVKERTEGYPIFRQRCYYTDAQGNRAWFDKVYEPHNYQKQFRFHSIGQKPQGYIFGLDAVIEEYQRNGSKKLDSLFLVSGGSDAVACWSRGQAAVWMGS